jgi:hypothetical protein
MHLRTQESLSYGIKEFKKEFIIEGSYGISYGMKEFENTVGMAVTGWFLSACLCCCCCCCCCCTHTQTHTHTHKQTNKQATTQDTNVKNIVGMAVPGFLVQSHPYTSVHVQENIVGNK